MTQLDPRPSNQQGSVARNRRRRRWARAEAATTPGRLRLLFSVVTLTAVVVGAMAVATVLNLRDTAVTVAYRTSPTVVDAAQVRAVLADADRVAVRSLLPPAADAPRTTSGPGGPYQEDIKTAGQVLERAADNNTTGQAGREQIRTVNDLLVVYLGNVGQAHAYATADAMALAGSRPKKADLTVVYLAYAAEQMRAAPTGILAKVEKFRLANQKNLPDEGSRPWLSLGVHLAAGLVLLGLVIGTQLFFRRRFNRRISPQLVAAAAIVLLVCGWTTAQSLRTGRALDDGVRETDRITCLWQARTVAAIVDRDHRFSVYVYLKTSQAQTPVGVCTAVTPTDTQRLGGTPADGLLRYEDAALQGSFRTFVSAPPVAADGEDSGYQTLDRSLQHRLDGRRARLDEALNAAVPTRGLEWILIFCVTGVIVLTILAFRPRLREYRA
jgi:hypothetical protein